MSRPLLHLAAVAGLLMTTTGATCNRGPVPSPYLPPPPVAMSTVPTLAEVAAAVNRTAAVSVLSTNSATLEVTSMPSLPKLKTTLHARRERDFRLRASVPLVLTGGIDIGSNADQFWFSVPEGMTMRKTTYFASHDQYAASPGRSILPVDPTWLIDAIGLTRIDPARIIAGPMRRSDGAIELHQQSPAGDGLHVLYVDPTAGYVTDQFIYDAANRLIASSNASAAVYYPIPASVPAGTRPDQRPDRRPDQRCRAAPPGQSVACTGECSAADTLIVGVGLQRQSVALGRTQFVHHAHWHSHV